MSRDEFFLPDTMTADEFMAQYMPIDRKSLAKRPKVNFKGLDLDESSALRDQIRASRLLPGYQLLQSKNLKFSEEDFNISDKGHGPFVIFPPGDDPWKDSATSWHALEMHINYTSGADEDPLEIKNKTRWGLEARKDIVKYISTQFSRQPRTSAFSVVIFGRHARLLIWDRSACIATKKFNWITSPRLLPEFLWRFAHLNRQQRGFDTTVLDASLAEERALKRAIRNFIKNSTRDASFIRPSLSNQYPVYKVHLKEPTTGEEHLLIFGKPFYERAGIEGVATKVYAAYSKTEKRIVILRDSWCHIRHAFSEESDVYAGFEENSVPHVPKSLYIGVVSVDGETQITRKDQFVKGSFCYRHQRVIQEVLFPLQTVKSSKELTQVTRDAVKAMSVAYSSLNLLHQDISIGNVMVTEDGRGVLNDWGCAMKDIPKYNRLHNTQTGTWAFLSVKLLQAPWKAFPREIHDDLESFFWLLLWVGARHVKSTAFWPQKSWEVFFEMWGTCYTSNGGHRIDTDTNRGIRVREGGRLKREFISESPRRCERKMDDMQWRCQPFNALMHELRRIFGALVVYPRDNDPSFRKSSLEKRKKDYADEMEEQREKAMEQYAFLSDPENIVRLFDEALAKDDWLEDDIVPDMLPDTDDEWESYARISFLWERFIYQPALRTAIDSLSLDVTNYPPTVPSRDERTRQWVKPRRSARSQKPTAKCIANDALKIVKKKRRNLGILEERKSKKVRRI